MTCKPPATREIKKCPPAVLFGDFGVYAEELKDGFVYRVRRRRRQPGDKDLLRGPSKAAALRSAVELAANADPLMARAVVRVGMARSAEVQGALRYLREELPDLNDQTRIGPACLEAAQAIAGLRGALDANQTLQEEQEEELRVVSIERDALKAEVEQLKSEIKRQPSKVVIEHEPEPFADLYRTRARALAHLVACHLHGGALQLFAAWVAGEIEPAEPMRANLTEYLQHLQTFEGRAPSKLESGIADAYVSVLLNQANRALKGDSP